MSDVANPPQDLFQTLRSLDFLRKLKDEHIRDLMSIAKMVEFPAGTVIFSECDPASHCYLIVSGNVLLEICGPDRCTKILTMSSGELLGWSTLLGAPRLTATARAQESTQAIELLGADVLKLCEANHDFGYELMKCVARTLSGRLTATRLQLLDLFNG